MLVRRSIILCLIAICLAVVGCTHEERAAWSNRRGAEVVGDSIRFTLYAPTHERVWVVGSFSDWQKIEMRKEKDVFRLTIEKPGSEFMLYQYVLSNGVRIGDPYSVTVLDPLNDWELPRSSWVRQLPPYPVSETQGFVTVLQLLPQPYRWDTSDGYRTPTTSQLNIYELCVRDYCVSDAEGGNLELLQESIDSLASLGVNAVELMPIAEFEGNDSWGYMPVFPFALDKAYGRMSSLKRFVDNVHSRGMAVILDIVLNHTSAMCPLVTMASDGKGNPREDNPWYNTRSNFANPDLQWGQDFNHESHQTQMLVDSILSFWIKEYHVDGFRLDFTKGFSNRFHPVEGSDSLGVKYDRRRIELLKRLHLSVRKVKPDVIMICEHFADEPEELELAKDGYLMWTDASSAFQQCVMGYEEGSDVSQIDYKYRGWWSPRAVGYMESHDTERMMRKCLNMGREDAPEASPRDTATALKRVGAAATILGAIPGPKMIWQYGEYGFDVSINDGGRTSRKRIDRSLMTDSLHIELKNKFAKIMRLRKDDPLFSTSDYDADLRGLVKTVHLRYGDRECLTIANFDVYPHEYLLPHSPSGEWVDCFTSKIFSTMSGGKKITLPPAASYLFMTEQSK